jgi:protein MpaA
VRSVKETRSWRSVLAVPSTTVRVRRLLVVNALAALGLLAACASADGTSSAGPAVASVDRAGTTGAATTGAAPTTASSSAPSVASTAAAATRPQSVTLPVPTQPASTAPAPSSTTAPAPTTTIPAPPPAVSPIPAADPNAPIGLRAVAAATDAIQVLEIGRSRSGRPLMAVERGTPGGTPVLVLGVIHGNEDAGVSIVEDLATLPVPPGIDLWLLETMNPDGQAAQRRGNDAGVDLNRNFPYSWGPIGSPGDGQYAGTGPASEPETQAVVSFLSQIHPALTIWYHQDLYRLSPSQGLLGRLKQRYSELTGLPIIDITGGIYTGVAATWVNQSLGGYSFIVELGSTLSPVEAAVHAGAVLDIAAMVANG